MPKPKPSQRGPKPRGRAIRRAGDVIELKDGRGKVRIRIAADADGPTIQLRDARGRTKASVSVDPQGRPMALMSDASGAARLTLALGPTGSPRIIMCDGRGEPRLFLGTLDNLAALVLNDETGRCRAMVSVAEDDGPTITLQKDEKTKRVRLALDENGEPTWTSEEVDASEIPPETAN
jgi:hypothetical protein